MTHSIRDGWLAQVTEAVERGKTDHVVGVRLSENPYPYTGGLHEAWRVGWCSMIGKVAVDAPGRVPV